MTHPKKVLTLFSLIMINVIAIDSLRNVPAAAEYGLTLITYYVIAAVGFFIPSALVAAELATGWPKDGGIYIWVREAFGPHWGWVAVWLQWIENVIWYPTIMAFIAATFLYALHPSFAQDKILLLSIMLIVFWSITLLNLQGMQVSAYLSEISALFGTILPMLFIIALGVIWLMLDRPTKIDLSWQSLFPDLTHFKNLTYLTGILLSLVGTELSASYASSIKNPQRNYPIAMLISVIIILFSLVFSSLAISIVVSKEQISLVNGLVEAFAVFFKSYHMSWATGVIALVIIVGGIGNVAAWILGPSKALLAAAEDDNLPKIFNQVNRKGAPRNLLLMQAAIFTLFCTLYLLMPSLNSSYWVLTALATQLYMLMYLIMFIAAIRLRYSKPDVVRSYRIPGGNWGIWCVAGLGALSSFFAIFIGFLPPIGFNYGKLWHYEMILLSGFSILVLVPFIYIWLKDKITIHK